MNQAIKEKWVNALKSGEYEQGTDFLNKDGEFCCLGVLCDLYNKETGIEWEDAKWEDAKNQAPKHKIKSFLGQQAVLPSVVVEWAGLENDNPLILGYESLASINDKYESFKEIANLIEKYL